MGQIKMLDWFEVIIEVSHVGVIVTLLILGYIFGALFVLIYWIYYHRNLIKELFLLRSGKLSDEEIYSKRWEEYVDQYLKLKDWLNKNEKLKVKTVETEGLIGTLQEIRMNEISRNAMTLSSTAMLLSFLAIIIAFATFFGINPSKLTIWQSFFIIVVLIIGIVTFAIGIPLIKKIHKLI
jgi:hypothetical protein